MFIAQIWNVTLTQNKHAWSVDGDLGNAEGDPSTAVDSDRYSCMLTNPHPDAWWAVDLEQDVEITDFYVYHEYGSRSK